jgi:predicted AAA+ superfamily ATPase
MRRYLERYITRDLDSKIVFLTGPRQTGKTTLSKQLTDQYDYFNYDYAEDRLSLLEKSWDRSKQLIIFDESHKLKNWKSWLKGIFDKEGTQPALMVTGSAKLDTYRKAGDSLAGRFFQFRLHPLDLKEINTILGPIDIEKELDILLTVGGFPEPYLNGSQRFYKRWKRSHLDIILKQDLVELENVQEIIAVETLIQLLRKRVGSPVSYSSLARDLQCSDKSVKRWTTILENLYVIFKVTPYHRNIARSILKAPKYYFYDTGQVMGDEGARLENLVACALHKEIQYQVDCLGEEKKLYYLRDKDKREIDFFITDEDEPLLMLEVKWRDRTMSPAFNAFATYFPNAKKIQIVKILDRRRSFPNGVVVQRAGEWLTSVAL